MKSMLRLAIGLILLLGTFSSAAEAAGTIRIQWDPNSESDLASYRVSYGTSAGVYATSLTVPANTTTWDLTGLTEGERYFIVVQAVNTAGLSSGPSNEVNGVVPYSASTSSSTDAARVVLGIERFTNSGGWLAVKAGTALGVETRGWTRVNWGSYNGLNGETHPATGDVDGDGLDEVVVGFGRGGQGYLVVLDDDQHGYAELAWIQVDWAAYNNANGATYPAVGDLNGDGRAEIVAGLGTGGGGWFQVFGSANTGYERSRWGRVDWMAYNLANGETHPAIGDVDGDGRGEIIVGLGTGGAGWVQISKLAANNQSVVATPAKWLRVNWGGYNNSNGSTWPAAGDLNGNGRDEVVVGLGQYSAGWLEILGDSAANYASLRWVQTPWASFNSGRGETHPAVGNIDGDARAEIVVGLGAWPGSGGRLFMLDDASAGYGSLGTRTIGWTPYESFGGGLFVAVGKLR
jgi:hypothetical protein